MNSTLNGPSWTRPPDGTTVTGIFGGLRSLAHLASNKAALNFYETVRRDGTQKAAVPSMQTRAELYDFLGYHAYEDKLDHLFAASKNE